MPPSEPPEPDPPPPHYRTRSIVHSILNYCFASRDRDPRVAGSYYGQKLPCHNDKQSWGDYFKYLALGNYNQKVKAHTLDDKALHSVDWSQAFLMMSSADSRLQLLDLAEHYNFADATFDDWSIHALSAMLQGSDTPQWHEAMNGPDAPGFWVAMEKEIKTLEEKDVWDIVDHEDWMNVIKGIWAFRKKRFPDFSLKKLKARWCARGDTQIEGVDFFETFAPVVNWTTISDLTSAT